MKINVVLKNRPNVKEFRIFALKSNMQDFKINYKERGSRKNVKERKK